MRIVTLLLSTACLVLAACETPSQLSCQARLEQIRAQPGLTIDQRSAKLERQVQVCRAEQGDEVAMKWLDNNG